MAGKRRNLGALLVTLAGASVLAAGTASPAFADPLPRPSGRAQAGPVTTGREHLKARHPGTGRKARHHRPDTVVRCQSDDTDQIEEIDDGDEPRHFVSPGTTAPVGGCLGGKSAAGIAKLLAGDHRRGFHR